MKVTRVDTYLLGVISTARSNQVVMQKYVVVVRCCKMRRVLLRASLSVEPRRCHLGLFVAAFGTAEAFR